VYPYAYELELPASIRIHRVDSLVALLVEDSIEGQQIHPPPPVEVDGEEEYQVSGVEDGRVYRKSVTVSDMVDWTCFVEWETCEVCT